MTSAHRCQCPELGWPCPACRAESRRRLGHPGERRGGKRSRLARHHEAIVTAYAAGVPLRTIAAQHAVCTGTVHLYLKRQGVLENRTAWNQYRRGDA
jgi:hypothetical protein